MVAKQAKNTLALATKVERKLSDGVSFSLACEQVGWDEVEARKYFSDQSKTLHEDAYSVSKFAFQALKSGLETLEKISKDGPRCAGEKETLYNTDLDAAKSLVRFGVDILKMNKIQKGSVKRTQGRDENGNEFDLFDFANARDAALGPWRLRDGIDE